MDKEPLETPPPETAASEDQPQPDPSDQVTIRVKKRYLVVLLIAFLSFLAGYVTHALLGNLLSPAVAQQAPEAAAAQASAEPRTISNAELIDDDPAIGPADALITIVEFSDYECPFCKKFRDETLNRLLENYAGQIQFVYRDFPLRNIHPRAQIAAEAAECAGDQGDYWAMHDVLFSDQSTWSRVDDVYGRLEYYADELALDTALFLDCLKTGKFTDEIQADYEMGRALGITGTPGFVINGKLLSGAVPYEMFQSILERELFALSETE